MSSLFCRHNRFTADCPICSKGSVLSRQAPERTKPSKPAASRPRSGSGARKVAAPAVTRYPHVSVEIDAHEVRLEQVPGGLRLGSWRGGALEKKAPVLPAGALRELVEEARGRGYVQFDLPESQRGQLEADPDSFGVSPGRAGDLNEELRLERAAEAGHVRLARWIFWPGSGVGWELQDSPVMLPERRYEQALLDGVSKGLL